MFKENRFIFRETPSVPQIVGAVEGQKFSDLSARLRQIYGEREGFKKYREMLKRVEDKCRQIEEAFKNEPPDRLANRIRKGAMQEFELERQSVMAQLKRQAESVAKTARGLGEAPKAPPAELPVAPLNAQVRRMPDGKFYAVGKGFPLQEVQDPNVVLERQLAARAAKKAAAKKGWTQFDPADIEQEARARAAKKAATKAEKTPAKPKPRSKPGATPSKYRKMKLEGGKPVQVGGTKVKPSAAVERVAARSPKPKTPAAMPKKPEFMIYSDEAGVIRDMRTGEPVKGVQPADIERAAKQGAKKAPKGAAAKPLPKAPLNARVIAAEDGRFYASGRDFPLQEVQNPYPEGIPPEAKPVPVKPAAAAKAAARTTQYERFAPLKPPAARVAKQAARTAEQAAKVTRSEAELMKLLPTGKVTAQELQRLGWVIKTGWQDGKRITLLMKGGRWLGGAGKALKVVGGFVSKFAVPVQCFIIGWDIYVGYKCLKNEKKLIRQKRMAEGKDPNAPITARDLIHHVATNPDRERASYQQAAVEQDTAAYEAATKKLTFLGKAHEACVYAKGVIHDIRTLPSQLPEHNVSGWDIFNPGALLGEALATSDARNREQKNYADRIRNGAARCRSLKGQLSGMEHVLPHTKNVVMDALDRTALLADLAARAMERDGKTVRTDQSDGVFDMVHAAQRLVEADKRIARKEKRKNAPKRSPNIS